VRGSASGLPLILPQPQGPLAEADLAALGVRICLTPHRTLPAAMDAAWDSLAETPGAVAVEKPADLMADLGSAARYDALMARFLS
jgi:carboxyvinyl-carboxyphosphonate phosphorylmutase